MLKHLITGLALTGLALFSSSFAQYPDHAEATLNTTTVTVVWLPDFETADLVCGYIGGIPKQGTILACYAYLTHTIYAVQPSSFNDQYRLMILGHEFWHALGAEHP
jgi:hypothetical protein